MQCWARRSTNRVNREVKQTRLWYSAKIVADTENTETTTQLEERNHHNNNPMKNVASAISLQKAECEGKKWGRENTKTHMAKTISTKRKERKGDNHNMQDRWEKNSSRTESPWQEEHHPANAAGQWKRRIMTRNSQQPDRIWAGTGGRNRIVNVWTICWTINVSWKQKTESGRYGVTVGHRWIDPRQQRDRREIGGCDSHFVIRAPDWSPWARARERKSKNEATMKHIVLVLQNKEKANKKKIRTQSGIEFDKREGEVKSKTKRRWTRC